MKDLNHLRVELFNIAQRAGVGVAEFNIIWADLIGASNEHESQ